MNRLKFSLIFYFTLSFNIYAQPGISNSISDHIINGEYREAITELNEFIKTDSGAIAAYKKLAYCYNSLYDYQKSSEVLSAALRRDSSDTGLLLLLGNSYLNSDQHLNAKLSYRKYLIKNPGNPDGLLNLGKTHIALKEWGEGALIFQKLVDLDKSVASYHELLARCLEPLKILDDAIVHLQIANRLNPFNLNVVFRLCNLYFKTERDISAQRVAETSLELFPGSSDLWRIKAEALMRQNEMRTASECFGKTIEFGDTTANILRNLGICLYNINEVDSAILYLDSALHADRRDYASAFYLGMAYKDKDDYTYAIKYLEAVEKIQMNDYVIESFNNLGVVYQLSKDYKRSIYYFNRALELDPGNRSILFRIAATYDEGYADKKTALKYYKQFTEDTTGIDKKLYDYANNRIKQISQEMTE